MQPDSTIHWSSYPALLLAGAVAAGIVLETNVGAEGLAWLAGGAGGAMLWGTGVWWERRRIVTLGPLMEVAGLAVLALCAGGARQAAFHAPSPRSIAPMAAAVEAADEPVEVTGRVVDAPVQQAGTWRFTLQVDTVVVRGQPTRGSGRVRAILHNPLWISTIAYPTIQEGDKLWGAGRLSLAPGPRNPGAFDVAGYLARRGVCCTLYVRGAENVEVRGADRSLLAETVVQARAFVRGQLDRHVPSARSRAVLQALLLGDRTAVTDATEAQFASTGLMHLLAVSGLHVLLVGMVLYGLLRPVLMRVRIGWAMLEGTRAALTIGVLGFYMLLTGSRPSVVRAVVMAGVLIGGILTQRSSHALNSLGVAALVLLALRPPALFDAGFQLSMGAVAGIVTVHPRFMAAVPESWTSSSGIEWGVSTLSVSAAATLGTGPVLFAHFGQVAVAGLVLNVVAIPLTAVGLTAGILAVVFGSCIPVLGAAFGASADLFIGGLLETAEWGDDWLSWGVVTTSNPSAFVLAAGTVAVVALAQWPRPRTRWACVGVAAALLAASSWGPIATGWGPTLDVVFLDVGQGDAALVSTPRGQHLLVDVGPRTRFRDAGRRVLLPYLQRRGISRVDAVVITHPDSDHLGGLPTLLREIDIGRVLHSGRASDTRLYDESRHLLDSLAIPNRSLSAGDTVLLDESVRVEVLSPPRLNAEGRVAFGWSENDASVVLRVLYGQSRIFLTGDVERSAEAWLLDRYGDELESDVVKIPHHGSATSSGPRFVHRVARTDGRTHAIVSVGERNAFGLPDRAVLSRWQAATNHLHLTPQWGAVWIRSDGDEVWHVPWRKAQTAFRAHTEEANSDF